ncbi:MAG TPA: hypothetical protein PL112_02675 [Candidatus Obscuribacter sp.]|nr:hypothetical protein [Candidatus Obscuribacter sp.]HND65665.1 hypothetical protein [Candidatus Obscuribacter sp.]
MNCKNCHLEVESKWSFCPACGINLASLSKFSPARPATAEEKRRVETPSMQELVLDMVARQALSGADWQKVCRGAMEMYSISPNDVRGELFKRGYKFDEDGQPIKITGKARLHGLGENLVPLKARKKGEDEISVKSRLKELLEEALLAADGPCREKLQEACRLLQSL